MLAGAAAFAAPALAARAAEPVGASAVDLLDPWLEPSDDWLAPSGIEAPREATADASADPRVFYLWVADGVAKTPRWSGQICPSGEKSVAPAFTVGSGSVAAYLKSVVEILERLYRDFDMIVTFQPPTVAYFYTSIMTGATGAAWCGLDSPLAPGIALSDPLHGYPDNWSFGEEWTTSYVFLCSLLDAQRCAYVVARLQAVAVGLISTTDPTDVMFKNAAGDAVAFQNKDMATEGSSSMPKQNSYHRMIARLGAWPGGDKPSALSEPIPGGAGTDGGAAGGAGGSDGGADGSAGTGTDGAVGGQGGEGAGGTGGQAGSAEPPRRLPPNKGCSAAPGRGSLTALSASIPVLLALAGVLRLHRRRAGCRRAR